jgi:hypothetical protein
MRVESCVRRVRSTLDKTKNTVELQNIGAAAAVQASDNNQKINLLDEKPFKSAGYIAHNEITYRGVDFALNSTIGVGMTYWTQRTKSGQEMFAKPVTNFFKNVMKVFTQNSHTQAVGAKWGSMFTSIIVGGTTIIPMMTLLENKNNKKAIIKSIDEAVYGKEEVANDPKFSELYASIDHEPKKDFITGMAARLSVLFPMIVWTMTPALNDPTTKHVYDPMAKATKALADGMGIKAKKMKVTKLDGQTNWDFLHQTIAFDFGLTFVYSFLHEYAFKAFASMRGNHEKHESTEATHQHLATIEAQPEEKPAAIFADKVTAKDRPAKSESHTAYLAQQPEAAMGLAV